MGGRVSSAGLESVWGAVSRLDLCLAVQMHARLPSRRSRRVLVALSRVGDGWLWGALTMCLWVSGGELSRAGTAILCAGAVCCLTMWLVKSRIHRPRPCDLMPYPDQPLHAWSWDPFSFPSGHAMNGAAVCTILCLQFPAFVPVLVWLPLAIAGARVALGLHFLSDVVVGGMIGWVVGLAVFRVLSGVVG